VYRRNYVFGIFRHCAERRKRKAQYEISTKTPQGFSPNDALFAPVAAIAAEETIAQAWSVSRPSAPWPRRNNAKDVNRLGQNHCDKILDPDAQRNR
jgi:hypothetical protein